MEPTPRLSILKHGWLHKRVLGVRWHKRYFVLFAGSTKLFYFKSEDAAKTFIELNPGTPYHWIQLEASDVVTPMLRDKSRLPIQGSGFVVENTSHHFNLCASSVQDSKLWCDAVSQAVGLLNGKAPQRATTPGVAAPKATLRLLIPSAEPQSPRSPFPPTGCLSPTALPVSPCLSPADPLPIQFDAQNCDVSLSGAYESVTRTADIAWEGSVHIKTHMIWHARFLKLSKQRIAWYKPDNTASPKCVVDLGNILHAARSGESSRSLTLVVSGLQRLEGDAGFSVEKDNETCVEVTFRARAQQRTFWENIIRLTSWTRGVRAFSDALYSGDVVALKHVVKRGMPCSDPAILKGELPLHLACGLYATNPETYSADVLEYALGEYPRAASLVAQSGKFAGYTPFHMVVSNRKCAPSIVQLLLNADRTVIARPVQSLGMLPIHTAAAAHFLVAVQIIMADDGGRSCVFVDRRGRCGLHHANLPTDCVGDVSAQESALRASALSQLILRYSPECARVRDMDGNHGLHLAIPLVDRATVELLVGTFGKACRVKNHKGELPVHLLWASKNVFASLGAEEKFQEDDWTRKLALVVFHHPTGLHEPFPGGNKWERPVDRLTQEECQFVARYTKQLSHSFKPTQSKPRAGHQIGWACLSGCMSSGSKESPPNALPVRKPNSVQMVRRSRGQTQRPQLAGPAQLDFVSKSGFLRNNVRRYSTRQQVKDMEMEVAARKKLLENVKVNMEAARDIGREGVEVAHMNEKMTEAVHDDVGKVEAHVEQGIEDTNQGLDSAKHPFKLLGKLFM